MNVKGKTLPFRFFLKGGRGVCTKATDTPSKRILETVFFVCVLCVYSSENTISSVTTQQFNNHDMSIRSSRPRISLVFWAIELDTSLSSSICQPASINKSLSYSWWESLTSIVQSPKLWWIPWLCRLPPGQIICFFFCCLSCHGN